MSKNKDKYRQRRLGDNRWIEKYAIDNNDFDNDDLQLSQHAATPHDGEQWSGLQFVSFGSGSSGNCSFLGTENGGVLIDAGIDPQHVYRERHHRAK